MMILIGLLQQLWCEQTSLQMRDYAILGWRYSPEAVRQVSHNEVKGEAQPGVV